ncbi:protein-L-isoaspartate(D-aspartate) O-methyltransferase [Streptomyces qinzhouensis]|uniref:Protein-L-isoaspartate O-methyltransferase n=1 Tax=Streptomyces qinzhouensis TaxID=2599401 RepID=A0A5B8IKR3_9ACTN|nr:protein-L-isoaspartate(D-aspartate) O-methyltransferase [Streptomyces qinzhouensis]QDY79108.1 protein-L-isoaspartate(D-aspartate) O-methyltransferase [Streptomyces qinzhouensis]
MDWEHHARRLADSFLRPDSRWWHPVATTPRHCFVPAWFERADGGRAVRHGATDTRAWLDAAYADTTLVTRIGTAHADLTTPGTVIPNGRWATSSSTLPTLVVTMYRHAALADTSHLLVTTGTGYGTALACRRLGDGQVTSIDIDPYLVQAATGRLNDIGLRPRTAVGDITGELPGEFDRIVSTVAVRPVPASWLTALRPGGRLVTTIANTSLILVADKTADGGASGYIAPDKASFMATRHGDDYEPAIPAADVWEAADGDGEAVTTSRYPVLYVPDAWDIRSMLELKAPGIDHRIHQDDDGAVTLRMAHPDGSWARATAAGRREAPTVHQGGPRRLWDLLEKIRDHLNTWGELPVSEARVTITPAGRTTLSRGSWWSATL